jgi:hypothetical protein
MWLADMSAPQLSPGPEPTRPQTWWPQPYPISSCSAFKALFPLSGNIIFHCILFSTLNCNTFLLHHRLAYQGLLEYPHSWLRPKMSAIALGTTPRIHNTGDSVTKSLEIALSEFGSVLTDDERKQLQQVKGVPDASAALVFTAKLDASNSTRRGKSIGARAYSMLQSIQQFSVIVDTFVSANPNIAALVWGSVKLTILVSHPSRLEEVKIVFRLNLTILLDCSQYYLVLRIPC